MKRLLLLACLLNTLAIQAKQWTADEVRNIISRVNTYWQTNNPAEVRSFWDNAAYHTGNIEVYKLFSEKEGKKNSTEWTK